MEYQGILGNRYVQMVVFGLVMGLGGYATGRWGVPAQVVITEKIREVEKQIVVEKVRTEVKLVRVSDQETIKKLHREIYELKKPDGTYEKKVVEDLNINDVIHTKENTTQIVYVDKIVEKWSDRIIEKEKKVLKPMDWRVAAGVGVGIPYFLGQGSPGVPGMQGIVVNVEADRRIVGPFWFGVHANTQGVLGANVSVVF